MKRADGKADGKKRNWNRNAYGILILALLLWLCGGTGFAQDNLAADSEYNGAYGLTQSGQYSMARDEWLSFLKKYPENSQWMFAIHNLGICYYNLRDYENSARYFAIASNSPEFPLRDMALYYQGLSCSEQGKSLKRKKSLSAAPGSQASRPEGENPFFKTARDCFQRLTQEFPKSEHTADAHFYAGICCRELKLRDEAVREFTLAQTNEAQFALCGIYMNDQPPQYEVLLDAIEKLLQNNPPMPLRLKTLRLRADVFFAQGNYAKAESQFAAVAGADKFAEFLNPETETKSVLDIANFYYRWGEVLLKLDRYEDAAERFQRVESLSPNEYLLNYTRYQKILAIRNFMLQNPKQTKYTLDECVPVWESIRNWAIANQDISILYSVVHQLSVYYMDQGDVSRAMGLYQNLSVGDATPLSTLRDKAEVLAAAEKYNEAIPLYRSLFERYKAQEKNQIAGEMLYRILKIHGKTANYSAALTAADEFLRWDSFDKLSESLQMRVREEQARALYPLQRYAEAAKVWKALCEDFPANDKQPAWVISAANSFQKAKMYSDVVAFLEPFLTEDLNSEANVEANHLLGVAYRELAKMSESPVVRKRYLAAGCSALIRAYKSYNKSSAGYTRGDFLYYDLADSLLLSERFRECGTVLKKVEKVFPESKILDQFYFLQGRFCTESGNLAKAAEWLETLLKNCPKSSLREEATLILSQCYLKLGKMENAVETAKGLESSAALKNRGASVRAVAAMELKDYQAAVQAWDVILNSKEESMRAMIPEAMLSGAFCRLQLGQNEEVVTLLKKYLQLYPDGENLEVAYTHLLTALMNLEKWNELKIYLLEMEKQFSKSPVLPDGFYRLGMFCYGKGDMPEARAAFEKCILHAESADVAQLASLKIAWTYYNEGNYTQAEAFLRNMFLKFPEMLSGNRAQGNFLLGMTRFHANALDEALSLLLAARKEGLDTSYEENAGEIILQIYENQKQWEELLRAAEEHRKKFPDSPGAVRVQYKQAFALCMLTRYEDSITLCQEMIAKNDPLFVVKGFFLQGECYFAMQRYDDAIKAFYKVIYGVAEPTLQADALFEAARCFEMLKQKEQAKTHYQNLLDKFPQSDKVKLAKQRLKKL